MSVWIVGQSGCKVLGTTYRSVHMGVSKVKRVEDFKTQTLDFKTDVNVPS